MNLKNKTVVITGGSRGLGLEIAKLASNKGSNVHVLARGGKSLAEVEELGLGIKTHVADVTDYAQLEEVMQKIGGVDVLVNNAGIWLEGNLEDNSAEQISDVIDINVKGTLYSTQLVLPKMKEQNNGIIFNISSTLGVDIRPKLSVYTTSKWAVKAFTECIAAEVKESNIKVMGFYPGGMDTGLFRDAGFDKDQLTYMKTEEVAEIVLFMLERNDSMVMDHVVVRKRG